MYNRKEIKLKSKAAFKANYWKTVLVAFIMSIAAGGTVGSAGGGAAQNFSPDGAEKSIEAAQQQMDNLFSSNPQATAIALAVVLGVVAIALLIASAIAIFVIQPLRIGACSFYAKNETAPAEIGELGEGFRNGYMRNVLAMFLVGLFVSLGTCLFVIPGILFAYGFRMVPYVLAEHPEMTAMEALKESHRLMAGNRWHLFVLGLSFIGWDLLTGLTLGILGFFFVIPYKEQAHAGFYEAVKALKE